MSSTNSLSIRRIKKEKRGAPRFSSVTLISLGPKLTCNQPSFIYSLATNALISALAVAIGVSASPIANPSA